VNRSRRRIALYLGAAFVAAGILRLEQELLLRWSSEPAAVCPPPRPPRTEPPLEVRLGDYRRLHEMKASVPELEKTEREIEALAGALEPDALVATILREPSPVAASFLSRLLEAGLARDREGWEAALVRALERVEPARLEGAAAFALPRLRGEAARDAVALRLLDAGRSDDRLNALAARFAEGPATARVRDALWARTPGEGAVEGLGHLIEGSEASRLASLGARPCVARALEAAWDRTGDPAFREALARLQ
jgi:hypothetical protein